MSFFFFKQKTAYDVRISDWSSDVCSSDLPARRRRAGGRLDHVMIGHDQEAAVEHTLLAGEHGRHRRLHILVDTASRHTAEERERPGMGIEQHLLALARIGPARGCARVAEKSGSASCRERVGQYGKSSVV